MPYGREEGDWVCQQPLGSLGLCILVLAVAVGCEGTFHAIESRVLLDSTGRASRDASGHSLLRDMRKDVRRRIVLTSLNAGSLTSLGTVGAGVGAHM